MNERKLNWSVSPENANSNLTVKEEKELVEMALQSQHEDNERYLINCWQVMYMDEK